MQPPAMGILAGDREGPSVVPAAAEQAVVVKALGEEDPSSRLCRLGGGCREAIRQE